MPEFVHLSLPRRAAKELLGFLGAFASSEMNKEVLKAAGVKIPDALDKALLGAAIGLNYTALQYLSAYANNDAEISKHGFFQKLKKAGISDQDANILYTQTWTPQRSLIANEREGQRELDAEGLAKILDCSADHAAFMLGLSNDSNILKIALAVNNSGVISIAVAGIIVYFTGAIPFNNPFVSRLLTSACAQAGTRLLQEGINKAIYKIGLYAVSSDKKQLQKPISDESSPLIYNSAGGNSGNSSSSSFLSAEQEEEIGPTEEIIITPAGSLT